MKLNVETVHVGGEYKTNCYLLENTETKELILIDPGSQAELILEAIGERTPVAGVDYPRAFRSLFPPWMRSAGGTISPCISMRWTRPS